MDERKLSKVIHHAVDTSLSGITGDPWLARRVLANAKGEIKVKKKLSAGLVLAIVLMVAAVTALAAITLHAYYEKTIEQTAQSGLVQDWNVDEKVRLVDWMVEAGLELSADQVARLHDDSLSPEQRATLAMEIISGYYPARQGALTVVDIIAKEKGPYETWSIEDKAWFTQMLYQFGEPENSSLYTYNLLPDNSQGDITKDEAIHIARGMLKQQYGLSDGDLDKMTLNEYFVLSEDKFYRLPGDEDDRHGTLRLWMIRYVPQGTLSEYWVDMRNDGIVLEYGEPIMENPAMEETSSPEASHEEIMAIWELKSMVEDPNYWTVENAASFSKTYRQSILDFQVTKHQEAMRSFLLALCDIPYGLPSANDVSQAEAGTIARKAILERRGWPEAYLSTYKMTISYRAYNGEAPYWRVCYKLTSHSDRALFYEGVLPLGIVINIEADSGNILMYSEMDGLDEFDYSTEFPDPHDKHAPSGLG